MTRATGRRCHALSFRYGQRHAVELAAAARVATALGAATHADHRPRPAGDRRFGADGRHRRPEGSRRGRDRQPASRSPTSPRATRSSSRTRSRWPRFATPRRSSSASTCSTRPATRTAGPSGWRRCRRWRASAPRRASSGGRSRSARRSSRCRRREIIRAGVKLGVDYGLTHSCYDPAPSGAACGACDACQLRRRGFEAADVPDPTLLSRSDVLRRVRTDGVRESSPATRPVALQRGRRIRALRRSAMASAARSVSGASSRGRRTCRCPGTWGGTERRGCAPRPRAAEVHRRRAGSGRPVAAGPGGRRRDRRARDRRGRDRRRAAGRGRGRDRGGDAAPPRRRLSIATACASASASSSVSSGRGAPSAMIGRPTRVASAASAWDTISASRSASSTNSRECRRIAAGRSSTGRMSRSAIRICRAISVSRRDGRSRSNAAARTPALTSWPTSRTPLLSGSSASRSARQHQHGEQQRVRRRHRSHRRRSIERRQVAPEPRRGAAPPRRRPVRP